MGDTLESVTMTTIDNQTSPPLARATQRPAAEFHEYVIAYARGQRWNVFLIFAGVTLAIGAAMYLSGGWLIIAVSLGLGLSGAGGGGLLIAAGAHASYTRHLGMTTTRTYAEPPPAGAVVRPFIPSSNPATVRVGRFQLPPATWAALFNAAEANDGRLTRDTAARVLPRAMYRNWQSTLEEFQRLGLIDGDGRVTAAGRTFARRDESPRPIHADAQTGAHSTHARRTHGARPPAGVAG